MLNFFTANEANFQFAAGQWPHVSFASVLQNIERQTVFTGGPKIFWLQENPGFLVLFVCILLFCKENKLPDQKKFHKPQKVRFNSGPGE